MGDSMSLMQWSFRNAQVLAVTLTLWFAASARADAPENITATPQQLIDRLGDIDPQVRQGAFDQLGSMGTAAKEALEEAKASSNPAIANAAGALLGSLPWYNTDDPPEVRTHLEKYVAGELEIRRMLISQLPQLRTPAAGIVWLRIMAQEPAAELRWALVAIVIARPGLAEGEVLRSLPPADAPAMAASGWAWRRHDRPKARSLLMDAYKIEAASPTENNAAIGAIGQWLIEANLLDKQFDQAAEICRFAQQREEILGDRGDGDWPLLRLMNLHARFGPLETFESDLRRYGRQVKSAVTIYVIAECLAERHQPLTASMVRLIAFSMGANDPSHRLNTAWSLMALGWSEPARRELRAVLTQSVIGPQDAQPIEVPARAMAQVALARLEGLAGRDALSAWWWQQAIPTLREFPNLQMAGAAVEGDSIVHAREQMLWRQLRVAAATGDAQHETELVDELVEYGTADADILNDLLPILRSRGRQADADRIFAAAYELFKAQLDQTPDQAEAMNNLAWVGGRSGERLEEAFALSSAAVELEPDNAAYLDTLAEVNFRRGDAAVAVELERRALLLRPGDPFMETQLRRYEAGKAVAH